MGDGLTDKQSAFVREYMVDLNATQAAIRAGYSPDTAGAIGWENLQKPEIAAEVAEAMEARGRRTEADADRVSRELARAGFVDPRKLFDADGRLLPVHLLDDDTAAAIASYDVAVSADGKTTTKVRFVSKLSALELLGRHLGMFKPQPEPPPDTPGWLSDEDRAGAILRLLKAFSGTGPT